MKAKFGLIAFLVMFVFAFIACDLNDKENNTKTSVEPLIKTSWKGGAPYNKMVPIDGGSRSAVGCVAVSMAQIMHYHQYPARGMGQRETYTTTNGIIVPTVDFNVDYDWTNMLNSYRSDGSDSNEQQQNAVATLMYHAGLSVKMNYNANGSEPFGLTAGPFVNTFGYDRGIENHRRSFYNSDAEWGALIKPQLDAGLPVMIGGSNSSGGSHRFIIDGYDNEGKFHVNGGGGCADGWFYFSEMTYNVTQSIYINIKPDKDGVSKNSEVMALDVFTADSHSVPQNEAFKVTVKLRGVGIFSGGHVGAALINNSGHIEAITGIRNTGGRPAGDVTGSIEIYCNVPETVNPGQYSLRIVTRPTDGEWRIVTLSVLSDGVPSSIPFTVSPAQSVTPGGGYGLVLQDFSPEKTSVPKNEQFTVTLKLINRDDERYPGGQFGAALVDNNGDIVKVIGTRNYGSLGANSYTTGSLTMNNCSVPDDVPAGKYQLRIVVASPTGAQWRIVNMSETDIPASINFTVE